MTALAPSYALSQEVAALRPVVRAVIACVLGDAKSHPDVEDGTHETLRRARKRRSLQREMLGDGIRGENGVHAATACLA